MSPAWPAGVDPYQSPAYDADEYRKWYDYLRRCEDPNRHFVYVLETERRETYRGVDIDDVWGHPDLAPDARAATEDFVEHRGVEGISRMRTPSDYHYRYVHPIGNKKEAIDMWVIFAFEANSVAYVGETENIAHRYKEHMNGKNEPKLFKFFKPTGQIKVGECLPRNPVDCERKMAIKITSFGTQGVYLDWDEINIFAYSGQSGRRYDTEIGWEKAPDIVKEHPGWKEYWEGGGDGRYDPLKD